MLNSILSFFVKAFKSPDVRKKILITSLVLVFFRLASHIPAAGIDRQSLASLFLGSPLLSLLDVFSGGTLANFSIMALGLAPYINASIILQLMTYVIPSLESLSKEGEYGQEKINQYTRLLTIPLSVLQGFGMYTLLRSQGIIGTLNPLELISLVSTMLAGTMFSIWLGQLITEYGVGNGVSFLIFAGIVSRLPVTIGQSASVLTGQDIIKVVVFMIMAIVTIGLVVFINEATRRIPVSYARKVGQSGLTSTYIPLRLNQAGVIPIIFAVSLVLLPSLASQFLSSSGNPSLTEIAVKINGIFSPNSFIYNASYFLLVVGFTYFYTSVVFNTERISENLQKSGGFVPGIRPGPQTASYLNRVLNKITLVGALFLGVIAVLPSAFQNFVGVANLAVGGTGILIVVSVVLEFVREMESQLVMRKYDALIRT